MEGREDADRGGAANQPTTQVTIVMLLSFKNLVSFPFIVSYVQWQRQVLLVYFSCHLFHDYKLNHLFVYMFKNRVSKFR